MQYDHRTHCLAPPRVGYPDDRARGGLVELTDDAFDFGRVHVLSAGDDDVLLAVDQMQQTPVVEPADVTGVTPSVAQRRQCRRLVIPVATKERI